MVRFTSASAALLIALQVNLGSATLLASRSNLRQAAHEPGSCDCSNCIGQRRNGGGDGTVGFQCFPGKEGLHECKQAGSVRDWVVQSAGVITYDRFCLYTCRPLFTKQIQPKTECRQLTAEEIKLNAQSPSYNGKEIIYQNNPMTLVTPLSKIVPMGETALIAYGPPGKRPSDPVAQMRMAFTQTRQEQAPDDEVPPDFYGPPCVCVCGPPKVDRFRLTEGNVNDYPRPAQVNAPMRSESEPPEPPMPPPPPAQLPPPIMPLSDQSIIDVLPGIPEAPIEVTGKLALPEWPSSKPVLSVQEASTDDAAASLLNVVQPQTVFGTAPTKIAMAPPSRRFLSLLQQDSTAESKHQPKICSCDC